MAEEIEAVGGLRYPLVLSQRVATVSLQMVKVVTVA